MKLETERLVIRTLQKDDYPDMLRVFGSFLPFKDQELEDNVKGWMANYLPHQEKHGFGMYPVILKETGVLIGNIGLEFYEEIDGKSEVELAYEFGREYWGNGYATEAGKAVREYAFNELGMKRLVTFISDDHKASRKVVEKLGFVIEKEIPKDGQQVLVYTYEI